MLRYINCYNESTVGADDSVEASYEVASSPRPLKMGLVSTACAERVYGSVKENDIIVNSQ